MESFKQKGKTQKKNWTKIWKKKIIYIYIYKTTTGWAMAWFSPDIYYLLLIFNYFFLFILNHTHLLSPQFLHFILLNFITSSSIFLHLRFAFLLVHNFCVFYQYQCSNASSQVLSLKFLNTIFFFLAVQVPLFISFLFIFFPFEIFWFTKCKFVLVLRTI